jgi:hypothetical protein
MKKTNKVLVAVTAALTLGAASPAFADDWFQVHRNYGGNYEGAVVYVGAPPAWYAVPAAVYAPAFIDQPQMTYVYRQPAYAPLQVVVVPASIDPRSQTTFVYRQSAHASRATVVVPVSVDPRSQVTFVYR